jgi:hypothetical protein
MKKQVLLVTGVACVAAVLGGGYVVLRLVGVVEPNACISEQRMSIPDLSGTKVEVVYTNCDTLAKDESISIYLSRAKRESWFAKWWDHRVLVFRYDPGRSDSPLPSITRASDSSILISIPEVSSVAHQSRNWENISIAYNLGKVDYPATPR